MASEAMVHDVMSMTTSDFNGWWDGQTFKIWWHHYQEMISSDAWIEREPMSALTVWVKDICVAKEYPSL